MSSFLNYLDINDTLEYSLMLIKPDAVNHKKEIFRRLLKNGFQILLRKKIRLFPEQAAELFENLRNLKSFGVIVHHLSKAPIEVMIVTKEKCIEDLLCLMGPERPSHARLYFPSSFRAIYGDKFDDFQNAIHVSRSHRDATREIHFFFPNFILELIPAKESGKLCCSSNFMDLLLKGLQKIPMDNSDAVPLLSRWLLENNPGQPTVFNAIPSKFTDQPIQDTYKEDLKSHISPRKKNQLTLKNKILPSTSPFSSYTSSTTTEMSYSSTEDCTFSQLQSTISSSIYHDEQIITPLSFFALESTLLSHGTSFTTNMISKNENQRKHSK